MAKTKLFLDIRTENKQGEHPVKLSLNHKSKRTTLATGIFLATDQWTGTEVKNHKRAKKLNEILRNKKTMADSIIIDLTNTGKLAGIDLKELRFRIENFNESPPEKEYTFFDHLDAVIETRIKERTKQLYRDTRRRVLEYTKSEKLKFSDIKKAWLDRFFINQSEKIAVNTIAIDMRNIRAVFNDAIDNDLIDQNLYPFRKYKIRTEETFKRSLTADQLRTLFDYPVQTHQRQYLDFFKLTFYLIGINAVDLLHAKNSQVKNGRLEYIREKTGHKYSIRIEPEAQQIIDQYAGKEYLINPMERYRNYKDYLHRCNDNLCLIGKVEWVLNQTKTRKNKKKITPLFPNLTTYWGRHSWAQLAKKLKIEKSTISDCLGHEHGSKVTDIYADIDLDLVDEANRKVIDHLLNTSQHPKNTRKKSKKQPVE